MNAPTRSRRDFLAAAAHVAGGSTLLWVLPSTRLLSKGRPRVLVLGAGLAGLRCALLLEASGCEVTILEPPSYKGWFIRGDRIPPKETSRNSPLSIPTRLSF